MQLELNRTLKELRLCFFLFSFPGIVFGKQGGEDPGLPFVLTAQRVPMPAHIDTRNTIDELVDPPFIYSQGVSYTLLLRIADFEIGGRVGVTLCDATDLSCHFLEMPAFSMDLASSVRLGPQIPMPLRSLLERAVRDSFTAYVGRSMVFPQGQKFRLQAPREDILTDEDIALATSAAREASLRC